MRNKLLTLIISATFLASALQSAQAFAAAPASSGKSQDSVTAATNTSSPAEDKDAIIQKVIEAGKKYMGTPYEYGSDRNDTSTFDCSDFVRQAYIDGANIRLPYGGTGQANYIKNKGNRTSTNWHELQPGDLIFFMAYKGNKESNYAGIDKSKEPITHVALYLGNGQILQTYSNKSGGVRIDSIEGKHWEYRILMGGSVL